MYILFNKEGKSTYRFFPSLRNALLALTQKETSDVFFYFPILFLDTHTQKDDAHETVVWLSALGFAPNDSFELIRLIRT